MKSFKKMFQKGISLLEVMLSLSIIAVILVMAVRYYSVANQSNNNNIALELLENLQSAVHQFKTINGSYTNLSTDSLCFYELVPPKNMTGCPNPCTVTASSTCTIPSPLGGDNITVAASGSTGNIVAAGLPSGPCNLLQSDIDGATCASGTLTIVVS